MCNELSAGEHIRRSHFQDEYAKETVDYITEAIASREPHQVITANPIMVTAALNDPSYMRLMKEAELIVPDGAGVVWAQATLGTLWRSG